MDLGQRKDKMEMGIFKKRFSPLAAGLARPLPARVQKGPTSPPNSLTQVLLFTCDQVANALSHIHGVIGYPLEIPAHQDQVHPGLK